MSTDHQPGQNSDIIEASIKAPHVAEQLHEAEAHHALNIEHQPERKDHFVKVQTALGLVAERLRELEAECARQIEHQKRRIEASNAKKAAKARIWREPMLIIAKANRPPNGNMTTAELVCRIIHSSSMSALVSHSPAELATGKKIKRLPVAKTMKNHIKWLEDDRQLNRHDKTCGKNNVRSLK